MCDDCMQWDAEEEDRVKAEGCTCACTGDSLVTHADGRVICKDCRHDIREEKG